MSVSSRTAPGAVGIFRLPLCTSCIAPMARGATLMTSSDPMLLCLASASLPGYWCRTGCPPATTCSGDTSSRWRRMCVPSSKIRPKTPIMWSSAAPSRNGSGPRSVPFLEMALVWLRSSSPRRSIPAHRLPYVPLLLAPMKASEQCRFLLDGAIHCPPSQELQAGRCALEGESIARREDGR
jgi:hypothetical protein